MSPGSSNLPFRNRIVPAVMATLVRLSVTLGGGTKRPGQ